MTKELDSLLSTPLNQLDNVTVVDGKVRDKTESERKSEARRLGYVKIPGVINLSFSRLSVLHSCPRKFFLREVAVEGVVRNDTVHTAFGSAFGAGIQELLRTGSLERALLFAFSHWSLDLDEQDYKSNKSVWTALRGVELFYLHYLPGLQEEGFELAYLDGKPCIELFYLIKFKDRYNHQGHIDIVLYNRKTNKLVVLEIKTTSRASHPADWQNSEQTLGYSVVLDSVAEQYGIGVGFEVEYLIYNPSINLSDEESNWGFTNYTFVKSGQTKADYLLDTMMDVQQIETYFENRFFPKRGNACRAFNRVCEYFGQCDQMFNMLIDYNLEELHQRYQEQEDAYESMSMKDVDFVSDFDSIMHTQETKDQSEHDEVLTPAVKELLK